MSSCPDGLPSTPDGRYFVHSGRLWRCSNPDLGADENERLVRDLMDARRAVRDAKAASDEGALRRARSRVQAAKVSLGERGPAWWGEGEVYDRKSPENTPYADWWAGLSEAEREVGA